MTRPSLFDQGPPGPLTVDHGPPDDGPPDLGRPCRPGPAVWSEPTILEERERSFVPSAAHAVAAVPGGFAVFWEYREGRSNGIRGRFIDLDGQLTGDITTVRDAQALWTDPTEMVARRFGDRVVVTWFDTRGALRQRSVSLDGQLVGGALRLIDPAGEFRATYLGRDRMAIVERAGTSGYLRYTIGDPPVSELHALREDGTVDEEAATSFPYITSSQVIDRDGRALFIHRASSGSGDEELRWGTAAWDTRYDAIPWTESRPFPADGLGHGPVAPVLGGLYAEVYRVSGSVLERLDATAPAIPLSAVRTDGSRLVTLPDGLLALTMAFEAPFVARLVASPVAASGVSEPVVVSRDECGTLDTGRWPSEVGDDGTLAVSWVENCDDVNRVWVRVRQPSLCD